MMRYSLGKLWHNSDFLKLWGGETVSLFGSQVTALALPLLAILTLHATSVQMGLLGALGFAPFLLFTLFAGVWIDHTRRKTILIISNFARACLLGLIPLSAFLGWLHIELLYIIAFLVGIFTVFFQLAYQAFLPSLLPSADLSEGNSKLTFSDSLSQVVGPGAAGLLIQLVRAPFAILLDCLSFLLSAFALTRIHHRETALPESEKEHNLWRNIREGFHFIWHIPYLRALAAESAVYNLFSNMIETIYVLYVVRELKFSPAILGLIFAIGSLGAVLASLFATQLAKRFGLGPTLTAGSLLPCATYALLPLANSSITGMLLLASIAFLGSFGLTIANIHVISLRQTITPSALLGRVNANYRFFTWGVIPIGYLLGGLLGALIGLRATLLIGSCGTILSWLILAFSPLAKLQDQSAAIALAKS